MKSLNENALRSKGALHLTSIVDYKGEKFTRTSYNGISVITDSDGYYNASKICKDNKTRFKDIKKQNYWTSYLERLRCGGYLSPTDPIKDRTDLSNDFKGTYIHKKLVNFRWFIKTVI